MTVNTRLNELWVGTQHFIHFLLFASTVFFSQPPAGFLHTHSPVFEGSLVQIVGPIQYAYEFLARAPEADTTQEE